jgi:predicted ribosome quality control (RQC) complex YloA/Tae2 family protein
MDTLLDAFETWTLGHGGKGLRTVALPPDLLLSLERALVQAERRVSRLRAELAAVEDPGELRALGDLLLARLATVPTGAAEAVLQDFEGNSVTVALDPSLPPHQNAQSFYAQASRAERAAARLPDLIQNAEATVADLEHLLDRARSGDTTPDEVRMALPPVVTPSQDRSAEPAVPYRVYRSSGGLEIRVGRGARHNDALTFHHAAPDDIWLHARHAAGAHVVMRWTDPGNPPARDLEEAAVLAALHSRSRTSGSVPVDWTRRKYVRKPRGSAPGTVIPQRVKTVFVAPDADVEERLKEG